ncbi:MAG: lysostaphin resistance A-like protein [Roseburia sp.]
MAKNFFKGAGKALIYFAVYFGMQLLVSLGMSVIITAGLMADARLPGGQIDYAALQSQATEEMYALSGWLILISGVVTLLIYWLGFLIRKKKFLAEVQISRINGRGILWIPLFGMAFNIVISLLMSVIPFPQSWVEAYAAKSSLVVEGSVLLNWFSTVLVAPVVEEIVFRGLVYTRLRRGMPKFVAAVIASLLFGVMHGSILWAIYTFAYSLILIWLFERFGSLTANILCHMAFNLAGMVLSVLPEMPGAAMAGICAVAVCVTAGAVFEINRLGNSGMGAKVQDEFLDA